MQLLRFPDKITQKIQHKIYGLAAKKKSANRCEFQDAIFLCGANSAMVKGVSVAMIIVVMHTYL